MREVYLEEGRGTRWGRGILGVVAVFREDVADIHYILALKLLEVLSEDLIEGVD